MVNTGGENNGESNKSNSTFTKLYKAVPSVTNCAKKLFAEYL